MVGKSPHIPGRSWGPLAPGGIERRSGERSAPAINPDQMTVREEGLGPCGPTQGPCRGSELEPSLPSLTWGHPFGSVSLAVKWG